MTALVTIRVSGFKSIEHALLDFRQINVFIGANGAGKSNLLSFFRLMSKMGEGRLQSYVATSGGANSFLFYGAKNTPEIQATLLFDSKPIRRRYQVKLAYSAGDTLVVAGEQIDGVPFVPPHDRSVVPAPGGRPETMLRDDVLARTDALEFAQFFQRSLSECAVFHFHDTSRASFIRRPGYVHDNKRLRHDGGNLAAVLYKLSQTQPAAYHRIVATVRQIGPWFDDFVIKPLALDPERVQLDWRERGSDVLFAPYQISDGTLRAIALITLLLQPEEDLPGVILVDEPELGLHPYALSLVAALAKQAACHSQIVLATQSAGWLNHFEPEDVVVVEREEGRSTFKHLEAEKLDEWLRDYSLGELWEKNVLGGGPM